MTPYLWYTPEELADEARRQGVSQGHARGVADATRTLAHPIFHRALEEGTERLVRACLGGHEVQDFVKGVLVSALSRATVGLALESRHDQRAMMTVQEVRMEPFVYRYATTILQEDLADYRGWK